MEVGEGKRGGGGRGKGKEEGEGRDGWGKVLGWCGLAVARDIKCAADKDLAAARFGIRRYC